MGRVCVAMRQLRAVGLIVTIEFVAVVELVAVISHLRQKLALFKVSNLNGAFLIEMIRNKMCSMRVLLLVRNINLILFIILLYPFLLSECPLR